MWHKPQLLNAISNLLMLVGGVLLLCAAGLWLLRFPALPVKEVVFMDPLPHTRRADLEQVLPAVMKGNFFSVRLEEVRATLERMPWVRKAEVRRVWPARLEVAIEEHTPVARWGEGRNELVNSFGEVFAATPSPEEGAAMPLLYGPQGTAPEVLKRYESLLKAFRQIGEKPAQLTLSPRLAWQTKLANGMLVDMGCEQPKSPLAERVQRFIEIYPERVAKLALRPAVVDLRYPNGFAMRSQGEDKGK